MHLQEHLARMHLVNPVFVMAMVLAYFLNVQAILRVMTATHARLIRVSTGFVCMRMHLQELPAWMHQDNQASAMEMETV